MADDNQHTPKTVIYRTDVPSHIEASLGILDFDQYFDNEYSKWKFAWSFVEEVLEYIDAGLIPLQKRNRMDLVPRKDPIHKMDRIWNGTCYLRVIRDSNDVNVIRRQFFYEPPSPTFKVRNYDGQMIDWKCEIIELPKLRRMVPVQQIKLDTWGVQTRVTWDTKNAWEGSQYGTVIEDGKFKFPQEVPKFEPHQMNEQSNRTQIFSRPVYQEISDILNYWMGKSYQKFSADMQKIRDWMREDYLDELDFDVDNAGEEQTIKTHVF